MRNTAEKRHNDWKKAIRKRCIDRDTQVSSDLYDNLHQYSKNKIRISNRYNKTNNKGHRRYMPKNYAPSKNWQPTDRRRIDEMEDQMLDNDQDL